MKVLLVNGSSHRNGCTFTALEEISIVLNKEGIKTEIFQLGNPEIRDCSGCQACRKLGKCVYDDVVNTFVAKAKEFDGFVFGTPVYYAHPSGRILSFLDRAFYSGSKAFAYKPAAAIASARRSGTTASFDVLNKYFTINNMPIISSNYWNNIHGHVAEEARKDMEGLQTMRNLARNMVWILKCIETGKKVGITPPEQEERIYTNFIR
ncbi:flavodoxin family protein [bacterium]|nr:flavodoxin family protein [bacterium]